MLLNILLNLALLTASARIHRSLCHQQEMRNMVEIANSIETIFASEFEVTTVRRRRRQTMTDINQNHIKFYGHLTRHLHTISAELALFDFQPFPTVQRRVQELTGLMEQEIIKSGGQIKKRHPRKLEKVNLDTYREKVTIHLAHAIQSILSVHIQCL